MYFQKLTFIMVLSKINIVVTDVVLRVSAKDNTRVVIALFIT